MQMTNHPIRKFFGLLVLYTIILFGIFTIQFKNQSVFSKNFGLLRLTLSENKTTDNNVTYNNAFQISYKGLILYSDKHNTLSFSSANGESYIPILTEWKELSDYSFSLFFNDGSSLLCGLTGKNKNVLTLSLETEQSVNSVQIAYKTTTAYSAQESAKKRIIFKSKLNQTMLLAPEINSNTIYIYPNENTITYSEYIPSSKYQFATSEAFEWSKSIVYDAFLKQLKDTFINLYISSHSALTEPVVSAYLTEMAARGKYIDALNNIPVSFKTNTKRTYLTSPYVNSLVQMYPSLEMQQENILYKMNHSIQKGDLDIFEVDSLYTFLLTQPDSIISTILTLPSTHPEIKPTISQATEILETYIHLGEIKPTLALLLEPTLESCLSTIQDACIQDNEYLYLSNGVDNIPLLSALKTGNTLVKYGQLMMRNDLVSSGYLIINSQLQNIPTFDLRTIADVYAILQKQSTYYPHQQYITTINNKPIWAWTIAQSIDIEVDETGDRIIKTKFNANATHHMILTGIEPFVSIEIYGIPFRSDDRFESYNSSGYVYDASKKVLFLKFRHRNNEEIIKLSNREPEVLEVETETVEATTTEAENTTTTPTATTNESQNTTNSETQPTSTPQRQRRPPASIPPAGIPPFKPITPTEE